MKMIIEIEDSQTKAFNELVKTNSYIKAEPLSNIDAELIDEIMEIRKAFENAEKLKSGKMGARSVEDLLNEL